MLIVIKKNGQKKYHPNMTTYHEDYCFQNNKGNYYLTQNEKEIYNPYALGWR